MVQIVVLGFCLLFHGHGHGCCLSKGVIMLSFFVLSLVGAVGAYHYTGSWVAALAVIMGLLFYCLADINSANRYR